jgi:hypothetical protein
MPQEEAVQQNEPVVTPQIQPVPETTKSWTEHVGVQYVNAVVASMAPVVENDPDIKATATVPFAGPTDNSALGTIPATNVFTALLRYKASDDTCQLDYDQGLVGAGNIKDGAEWGLAPSLEPGSGYVDINGAVTVNVLHHAVTGDAGTLTPLKKGKTATPFPAAELVTLTEAQNILGVKWVTTEFIASRRFDRLYQEQEVYPPT